MLKNINITSMAFTKETATEAGKKSKRGQDKQMKEARDVFKEVLSDNKENVQVWLDEVAKDNPGKALELLLKLGSFVIPKPKFVEIQNNDCIKILNIDPIG